MPTSPHRIRRQRWAFRAGSAAAAFALRQRLRDDWQEVLLPAFEKAFDQEVPGGKVVHIPRIELALKIAPEEKTGALWSTLLHEQLRGQLQEILRARRDAPTEQTEWKQSTARQNRFQDLLHYLRSGSVPWESAGVSAAELAVELRETCRERWTDFLATMRAEHSPSLAFCFRLLQLLPAVESGPAVRSILREPSVPWQTALLEILASLLAPEQKRFGRHTQLQLVAIFLSEALAARPNESIPDFVAVARRALPLEGAALDTFLASLPAPAGSGASADSISRKGAWSKGISVETHAVTRTHRSFAKSRPVLSPGTPGVFQMEESSPRTAPEKDASLFEATVETDFPLLAAHSGLILLHPFLPRFFESTGVKEISNVQLSPFALPRAAALLHFLATGQDAVYEYDLGFVKVLLGLDPETALCVSEGLLVEADEEEAEGLLLSAVTHWTALKNTSVAGFRNSFLNRPGLLRNQDNGWKLQVERQPFDVLLDHLPWSISVVKLPWMERPLFTEW
ncbi:MAG: hypothetical protein QOD12_852 [Verrucomicrobiota bacterium]|jgi:hypothetical protein